MGETFGAPEGQLTEAEANARRAARARILRTSLVRVLDRILTKKLLESPPHQPREYEVGGTHGDTDLAALLRQSDEREAAEKARRKREHDLRQERAQFDDAFDNANDPAHNLKSMHHHADAATPRHTSVSAHDTFAPPTEGERRALQRLREWLREKTRRSEPPIPALDDPVRAGKPAWRPPLPGQPLRIELPPVTTTQPRFKWERRHDIAAIVIGLLWAAITGAVFVIWPGLATRVIFGVSVALFAPLVTWTVLDLVCPSWRIARRIFVLSSGLLATALVSYLLWPRAAAPSSQPTVYGYLALDCKYGTNGKADWYYSLSQDPKQIESPKFFGTNVLDERIITNKQLITCALHNDGTAAVYNVDLGFAYEVFWPVRTPRASFGDLTSTAAIRVARVPANGTYTLRFFDDMPGRDYFFAPLVRCSLDAPGSPGSRQECRLPQSEMYPVPSPFVQGMMFLPHYRSRTDCHGMTPPLAADQYECGLPTKRRK